MTMFKTYRELMNVSKFYQGWDGYNNAYVITSNKCIKALKEKGLDHAIPFGLEGFNLLGGHTIEVFGLSIFLDCDVIQFFHCGVPLGLGRCAYSTPWR